MAEHDDEEPQGSGKPIRSLEEQVRLVMRQPSMAETIGRAAANAMMLPGRDLDAAIKSWARMGENPGLREAFRAHASIASLGKFRMPTARELALVPPLPALTSPLKDLLLQSGKPHADLQRAIASIRTAWVGPDWLKTLATFEELNALSRAVRELKPFDPALSAGLRLDFGDWRQVRAIPERVLQSPEARPAFYAELGFREELVDFPDDAFEEVIEAASLLPPEFPALEEFGGWLSANPASDIEHNLVFQRLITVFETQVRSFIHEAMSREYGKDWPATRVPPDVRDRWARYRRSALKAGRPDAPLISFANLSDYIGIIEEDEAWARLFEPVFLRKEDVREAFKRLVPVRNDVGHSRPIAKHDALLCYSETSRIMRAIRASG